jgi:hypothetical protein
MVENIARRKKELEVLGKKWKLGIVNLSQCFDL